MLPIRFNLKITSTLASALLAGCSQNPAEPDWDDNGNAYARRETAICVDDDNRRIQDESCHRDGGSRFIYLGSGARIPYYRERAAMGNYRTTPLEGKSYSTAPQATNMVRSAAVSRGGFGGSTRSRGFLGGGS